jgi:hypothetical protein
LVIAIINSNYTGRFDLRFLRWPHGGRWMATSTMHNFGRPSSTSSKRPLDEKRVAESTASSSGGQGALYTLLFASPDFGLERFSDGVIVMTLVILRRTRCLWTLSWGRGKHVMMLFSIRPRTHSYLLELCDTSLLISQLHW